MKLNCNSAITFAILLGLTTISGCTSQERFAQSAVASLATATNNINNAFSDASSDDSRKHLISGDFNGDGWMDTAWASVCSDNEWSLVVQLDSLGESLEIENLHQHTPEVPIDEIRLESLPPGKFDTVCKLAPEDCRAGSAKSINMASDGILLVILDASASVIFWNAAQKKWVRHWLSD